jgi:hypothetical protein
MDVTKPYKFIGFGDIHSPKPYKLIGLRLLSGHRCLGRSVGAQQKVWVFMFFDPGPWASVGPLKVPLGYPWAFPGPPERPPGPKTNQSKKT